MVMDLFIQAAELTSAAMAGFGIKSFLSWRKAKKKLPDPSKPLPKRIDMVFNAAMDPVAIKSKVVYEQDDDLRCALCGANNMYFTANKDGTKNRCSKYHKGCPGCAELSEPHIHVNCWDCKFNFIMVREHT
jgi:hypothetical protein